MSLSITATKKQYGIKNAKVAAVLNKFDSIAVSNAVFNAFISGLYFEDAIDLINEALQAKVASRLDVFGYSSTNGKDHDQAWSNLQASRFLNTINKRQQASNKDRVQSIFWEGLPSDKIVGFSAVNLKLTIKNKPATSTKKKVATTKKTVETKKQTAAKKQAAAVSSTKKQAAAATKKKVAATKKQAVDNVIKGVDVLPIEEVIALVLNHPERDAIIARLTQVTPANKAANG